ncbi:hypothetical protein DK853_25580 [Klebsiella oxytoca]|nr:hypothetical protein DK853_25580 [Klebsiella oxytoca]
MTDITELAQREKFEAWAEEAGAQPWGYLKKQRNPSGGYSVQIYTYMWAAWKAADAELVEALEKVQQRIAELESRTVKLPKRLSPEGYHIDEAYMVDDIEGEYLDRDDVIAALTTAGIKVEAE